MLAKREVASLRKSQASGKLLREIAVAAKQGGADPSGNARLFAAVEKAKASNPLPPPKKDTSPLPIPPPLKPEDDDSTQGSLL